MPSHDRDKKVEPDPPRSPRDIDAVQAKGQAALVPQLLATAASQRAALIGAKQSGDCSKILLGAADLERTQLLLEVAAHVITHSAADASDLTMATLSAKQSAKALANDVAVARGQAERLHDAKTGHLSELELERPAPKTPAETQERANAVAPRGICDDKEVQGHDSQACPLEAEQRATLRTKVHDALLAMAVDWKLAIVKKELKDAIEELAKHHGLNPLAELLLDAISLGIGGKVASMAVKYTGRAGALAQLATAPAAETAMMPLTRTQRASNFLRLGSNPSAVTGLVKKLSDRATNALVVKADSPSVDISDQLDLVVQAWRSSVLDDVRQLTDPDLVVVSERLASVPYGQAYFDHKVASLTAAFRTVHGIGHAEDWRGEPLRLAWVTSPTRPARLATYRQRKLQPEQLLTDNVVDVGYALAGSPRLEFEEWVDPSMYAIALARESKPLRIDDNDARWATSPWLLFAPRDGFEMVGVNPEKDLR